MSGIFIATEKCALKKTFWKGAGPPFIGSSERKGMDVKISWLLPLLGIASLYMVFISAQFNKL